MHFDGDLAVAFAILATAARDVLKESAPAFVATHTRLGGEGEQLAHMVPNAGIRRRIPNEAWRPMAPWSSRR